MKLLEFSQNPFTQQDQELLKLLYSYCMDKNKHRILCIDLECTGKKPVRAEILQCSMTDGNGQLVMNRYYRPINVKEWPEAEEVHHISPKDVENQASFLVDLEYVQETLKNYDLIVTYCGSGYDIQILEGYGIVFDDTKYHYDVSDHFARLNGEILRGSDRNIVFRRKKLVECAEKLDIPAHFLDALHDASMDTSVTLYCFYKMVQLQCSGIIDKQIELGKEL